MSERKLCTCPLCEEWRQVADRRRACYRRLRGGIRPGLALGAIPCRDNCEQLIPFSRDEIFRKASGIQFGALYDILPRTDANYRTEPIFVLGGLSHGSPPVICGEHGTDFRRCWAQPVPHHNSILRQKDLRPGFRLANALDLGLTEYAEGLRLPTPLDYLPRAVMGFRADVAVEAEETAIMRRTVLQVIRNGSQLEGRPLAATCSPCDGVVVGSEDRPGFAHMSYLMIQTPEGYTKVPVPRCAVWLIHQGETVQRGQQLFLFAEPRHLGARGWDEVEKELGLNAEWLADEVFQAARLMHEGYNCWPSAYVVDQAPAANRAWIDMRPLLPYLRDDGFIVCPVMDRASAEPESLCFAAGDGGLAFDFLNSPQRTANVEFIQSAQEVAV